MGESTVGTRQSLTELEERTISYFCDGVRVLGLPPSVGEIYGLLFVSEDALCQADLVEKLGISKGSASQGLSLLKRLGALKEMKGLDQRRTYYKPNVNLKNLVGGFIRGQIRPHLRSGEAKLDRLQQIAESEQNAEKREFFQERLEKLEWWSRRAQSLFPLIQRVLGR